MGTGDFDGDGKADVYCRALPSSDYAGTVWTARSTGASFSRTSGALTGWCGWSGTTFGSSLVSN